MRPFAYEAAPDAGAAVAAIAARPGAKFLGGGTNLVDLMKRDVETPDALVDVSRLPGGIEELPDGTLRVGAAVRNTELATDPRVRRAHPVLAQAVLAGASGQLRNQATVGGNLLQRTRCAYFQDATKPCNKRAPGTGCPAREGSHRDLAILGHSEACVATHPSDMATALTALDARVRVLGPDGERVVPMPGLHRLPEDAPEHDTVLGHAELITAVDLPPLDLGPRAAYRKVRDRASFAFGLVSLAAILDLQGDTVRDVRLALGQVAHTPWRCHRAEAALRGAHATEEAFAAAADAELEAAEPLRDTAYKVPLAREVMVGTLAELAA